MTTTQGTTGNGVARLDVQEAALVALDAQLIGDVVSALTQANRTSGLLMSDMANLADKILTLHQAESWTRTIDGETGKLYTSAKAFYLSLNRQDRFPHLHKILRTEVISELMDGEKLAGIGVNELAALIGCDAAQVTRTVKALAPAKAEAEAQAEAEAKLDEIAAEAAAEAAATGASEAQAAHAAEAARAAAKAEAEAAAAVLTAEAEEAKAKAELEAEAKVTDNAGKAFIKATQGVRDQFHLMTSERQQEVAKLAGELATELAAALAAKAAPKAARRRRQQAAS